MGWGLEHISSRELAEWAAFAALEPFGEVRGDLRSGIVAATVANVNRDPQKRSKPFEAVDFMPNFENPKPRGMSGAETLALMRAFMPPRQEGGDPSQP